EVEVVPVRAEQQVRQHRDGEVRVAGRSAVGAGPALAAQAQALAIGGAERDARAQAALADLELALHAAREFLQRERHGHLVVLAGNLELAPLEAAAEGLEQIRQVDAAEVLLGRARARAAPAKADDPVRRRTELLPGTMAAEAVVGGALLLVLQRLVRLGDVLEFLL